MTDNEIVKALECCNKWKNPEDCTSCPAKGKGECCVLTLRIEALNLINRYEEKNSNLSSDLTSLQKDLTSAKAEIENLKDILYDAEGVNLVNYWHQQCKIAENGCKKFAKENKNLKADIERLKKENEMLKEEVYRKALL